MTQVCVEVLQKDTKEKYVQGWKTFKYKTLVWEHPWVVQGPASWLEWSKPSDGTHHYKSNQQQKEIRAMMIHGTNSMTVNLNKFKSLKFFEKHILTNIDIRGDRSQLRN